VHTPSTSLQLHDLEKRHEHALACFVLSSSQLPTKAPGPQASLQMLASVVLFTGALTMCSEHRRNIQM
jgi:hypothetical protein